MNFICGINSVLEALAAGTRHFDRLLVVKGIRNQRVSEAVSRASQQGVPLRFESRETLDRMAGGTPHQGLIAVVSQKSVIDLDALVSQAHEPALVVLLDGLEDPRNLGAVLRTAEAAGADGVVLPDRHSAGLTETVSRASAGGLEHVKVARVGNVVQAIEALKARGLWIVGFDAAGTERWDAVDYKRPLALVLGGEGRGIRRLVREHCDHLVSFPMFGHVGSLNVSVAAGIALYEVIRQRGAIPSHVRPIPVRTAGDARAGEAAARGNDEGHEDEAVTLRFLPDEEPQWAGPGPTVLKSVGRDRRSGGDRPRPRGRGSDRRGRGRGGQGPAPQRPQGQGREADAPNERPPAAPPVVDPGPRDAAGDPGQGGENAERRGRRRRRRRSGASPGPMPAPGQAAGGTSQPPNDDAQRSGGRRRRRRRRSGGPGGAPGGGGEGAV